MAETAGIYARESVYLERYVQLGIASGRVLAVSFPVEPDGDAAADHELLDRIFAYLEGTVDEFDDVTVALTLPTAQRTVLEAVREIPYGDQETVEHIAGRIATLDSSNTDDRTLVRTALEANPAPLLIPDHRVRDGPSAAPPEIEQRLRSLEGL